MAGQFSGMFTGGRSGNNDAANLLKYKQELDEYNDKRLQFMRQQDLDEQAPRFEAAIKDMTPERQAQMRLMQMMAGSQTMGDKGMEGFVKSMGQRGGTIADTQQAELRKDVHESNRLFDIANPNIENEPDMVQTVKAYMGLENYNNATDEERQTAFRDVKRQRQFVDTEVGFQDVHDRQNFIAKNAIQAGVDKARVPELTARLDKFYDDINTTEISMETTDNQRKRVQKLYNNVENNTGWWGLAASIPDIKSEGGSREWQQIRDTVVSNIGLDKIMALKAGSAQGATGLGALNEKELEMLQKHKGSLEQANSPEALRAVLLEMDQDMDLLQKRRMRMLKSERKWYNKNKYLAGEGKFDTPDAVPESQEYLMTGGVYERRVGDSPLDADAGNDLIKKWSQ